MITTSASGRVSLALAAATVYSEYGLGLMANTFFFFAMTVIAFYERTLRD